MSECSDETCTGAQFHGAFPAEENAAWDEKDSAGQSLSSQAFHLLQDCTSTLSLCLHLQISASPLPLFSFLVLLLSAIHSIPSTPLSRHPILPNRHLLFLTREKKGRTTITHSHPTPHWAPSTIPPTPKPQGTRPSAAAVQFLLGQQQQQNRIRTGFRCRPVRDLGLEKKSCWTNHLWVELAIQRGIETPPLYHNFPLGRDYSLFFSRSPFQPICTSKDHPHTTGILRLDDEESSNLHPLRSLRTAKTTAKCLHSGPLSLYPFDPSIHFVRLSGTTEAKVKKNILDLGPKCDILFSVLCHHRQERKKLQNIKKNLLEKRRSRTSIDVSRVVFISCKIFISVKLRSYTRCLGTSSVGHVPHCLSLLPTVPTRTSGKTHGTKLGSLPYHQRDCLRQVGFTWTLVQFPLQSSLTNWSKLVSNMCHAPFTDTRHHRRSSKNFEDSCLVGNVNSSLPPDPLELCHLLLREDQFTPLVRDPPLLVLKKSSALNSVCVHCSLLGA